MKYTLIFGAIAAVVFLCLAIFAHVWWYRYYDHRPIFVDIPEETISSIQNNSDIENLRKMALLLVQQNSQYGKTFNELLDSAVDLIVTLCLASAAFIGLLMLYTLKFLRKMAGQEPGWVRWF
jgi:hypothetical protein